MAYGTIQISDLLATTQQSVAEVGEENIFQAFDANLAVYNQRVREELAELVEMTTDRQRRYGGVDTMTMEQLSESGMPAPQKVSAGVTVGFPLNLFGIGVQWNLRAFRNMRASELASQFVAARTADLAAIERQFKRAVFRSANYTHTDRLVDNVQLAVKRLVNADSAAIPLGPDGTSFNAATHTHYLGTGSFVAADLTSLISTVIEHHNVGQARVYINSAQEATVRGFTGFSAYIDNRLVLPGGYTTITARGNLDMMNTFNRPIGVYGAAEVWVKPWIPASYLFAYVAGAPKPVVWRERDGENGNLRVAFDDERYPLRARTLEREFDMGVWTRTNGAVLYTGNATYADPTLN